MILVSSNGIAVRAAANDLNILKHGEIITTSDDYVTDMVKRGWELVDRFPGTPPAEVLQAVWGDEAEATADPRTPVEQAADRLLDYVTDAITAGREPDKVLRDLFIALLSDTSSAAVQELLQRLDAVPTGEPHAVEGSIEQGS